MQKYNSKSFVYNMNFIFNILIIIGHVNNKPMLYIVV